MSDDKPQEETYSAKNITFLTPREHVRKRPQMYVGGTGSRALHHLLWEVVDNSLEETIAGRCDRIRITLHSDTQISVSDNGQGIPVETSEYGRSWLEMLLTEIFCC